MKMAMGHAFGENFWDEVASLVVMESQTLDGVWCSEGRLETLVGAKEAHELIANKELPMKENAKGRKIYFYVEEKESRCATKQKAYNARQGPIRLRNNEIEQAFETFEGASISPVPWGVDGPSITKRPASVALDDEEKQTMRKKPCNSST